MSLYCSKLARPPPPPPNPRWRPIKFEKKWRHGLTSWGAVLTSWGCVRPPVWGCHLVRCYGVSMGDSSSREGEICTSLLTWWWIRLREGERMGVVSSVKVRCRTPEPPCWRDGTPFLTWWQTPLLTRWRTPEKVRCWYPREGEMANPREGEMAKPRAAVAH